MPLVGIGHLTMLDTAPPDWVTLAHDAGFDAVGIRAAAIGPTEEEWPMRAGSPMLAETLRRMDDTSVRVLDAEIIRIDPQTVIAKYEPLFETAAALGASFLNVMADDPELHRARDTFAALAEAARPYGLRPAIEAIPYMQVKTLSDAVVLVGESGGGIIIDPLHLQRGGGTPADVRSLDPKLIAYCQLCDAPLAAPHNLPRPRELPRGQSVEGITDLALEARAVRLLPGDGELPLGEIISAVPAGVPLSVETPNLALLGCAQCRGILQWNPLGGAVSSGQMTTLSRRCTSRPSRSGERSGLAPHRRPPPGSSRRAWSGCGRCRSAPFAGTRTCPGDVRC
jgi:sugar phosphate isomerase/epimerase